MQGVRGGVGDAAAGPGTAYMSAISPARSLSITTCTVEVTAPFFLSKTTLWRAQDAACVSAHHTRAATGTHGHACAPHSATCTQRPHNPSFTFTHWARGGLPRARGDAHTRLRVVRMCVSP